MEDLIQWLREADSRDSLRIIRAAVESSPLLTAAVCGLAVLIAASSRSLSFTLASALSAAVAIFIAATPALDGIDYLLTVAVICVQLFTLFGVWGFQRRIARDEAKRTKLIAEKQGIQQHLDDEIRWRQAAESIEEAFEATPPPARDRP
jgi:hypothetical protein